MKDQKQREVKPTFQEFCEQYFSKTLVPRYMPHIVMLVDFMADPGDRILIKPRPHGWGFAKKVHDGLLDEYNFLYKNPELLTNKDD